MTHSAPAVVTLLPTDHTEYDKNIMTTKNHDPPDRDITTRGGPTIDRRTLLKTVGLGTAVSTAGCVGRGVGNLGNSDDEHLPFDVWTEIREALRTSPDHLPARAEQLVSEGDPEAIFRFVRDEIATYPTEAHGLNGTDEVLRWGIRGTLRGGAGTPREKADLLVDLYRRVGFEAEVLSTGHLIEDRSGEEAAIQELLWQPIERPIEPEIDEAQAADWKERLELSSETEDEVTAIDADGEQSRALGQALFEHLPDERRAPSEFDWRWGGTPIVRAVIDDEEHYANLFTPTIPFGEAGHPPERLREADQASETPSVEISLSAATADKPEEPFDLVSGSWTVDDLIGRQLLVQTLPGIDPFEQPGVTFRDVQTFLPALTVQAMDLSGEEMSDLSVMGDAVTRAGDRLETHNDGTIVRNGEPFIAPEPAAAAADVAELEVDVDSSRHPEVRLNLHALDADGEPVEGLPATAFEVTDESQPVGVSLTVNQRAPRVLILSDTSLSMPNAYLEEGMEELVGTLQEDILTEHPNAKITHWKTNSDIWTYLNRAAGSDANLIVYATDGHVKDDLTPEIEAALRQGPPAVMLSVFDDLEHAELNEMADLTDGALVPASDQIAAEEAIMEFLAGQVSGLPTYVLTYGDPSDASGEHHVTVRVIGEDDDSTADETGEATIEANTTYTVPESPALAPHLAGLYLTVTVGKREVTRTLAGYDPARHHGQPITQEILSEVAGALFGSHTLSFEAAAPPFSVWFDDLLTAKLSVAGFDSALQTEDQEALAHEREHGFAFIPPELFLLSGPLPDAATDRSLTFQNGPRITLYQERPVFGADHIVRHADLLPFTEFTTATADPEEAFRLTLERTARLAVTEGALFETSTQSLLADRALIEIGDVDGDAWDNDREERWNRLLDSYSGRDYQLVPADGTFSSPFAAFWNVDYKTGEVVGVLGDGSGGGSSAARIRQQIEEIDKVISMLNLLVISATAAGAVAGPGGLALGVVAAYGHTLARLYGAASLAIAIMDASQVDEQVAAALASLVCNVAKKIAYALTGMWVVAMAENLLALGSSNPLSCQS